MNGMSGIDTPNDGGDGRDRSAEVLPARWFHLLGGERQGPVGLEEVRELVLEGSLGPDAWVWADGMTDWMRVREVPALIPPRALRITLQDWPDDRSGDGDGSNGASDTGD